MHHSHQLLLSIIFFVTAPLSAMSEQAKVVWLKKMKESSIKTSLVWGNVVAFTLKDSDETIYLWAHPHQKIGEPCYFSPMLIPNEQKQVSIIALDIQNNLFEAARIDNEQLIEHWLTYGADINARDCRDFSLNLAVQLTGAFVRADNKILCTDLAEIKLGVADYIKPVKKPSLAQTYGWTLADFKKQAQKDKIMASNQTILIDEDDSEATDEDNEMQ